MTDINILGAGPAGLTAAVYALRAGLSVQVISKGPVGGQTAETNEIANYPGIELIEGWDFAQKVYLQAKSLGARFIDDEIIKVELQDEVKMMVGQQGELYRSKALIVASGAKRRKLGVPSENELTGRGVSWCATCDGAFFKGKTAVVVGGGNTALEDALYLSNICKMVYLVHRRDTFRGERLLSRSVREKSNIELVLNNEVMEIEGKERVTGVAVRNRNTGACSRLMAEAVFIAIGMEPDNALFEGVLRLTPDGWFDSDERCNTVINGVYVAGDCRKKLLRQIVTAAADGAVAAYQAEGYLNARGE